MHNRLGHPSFFYLEHLFPGLFKGLDCTSFDCETCFLAKSHCSSYKIKPYCASELFYFIHNDVWGPSRITTLTGKKWFVTFIDDKVAKLFQDFYSMVENQFQTKISIIRSDNGTEFYNDCLGDFLLEKGILHQSTCRDTHQNGIVERKNEHLLEVGKALMFHMNVPTHLWGDAILTSYLINRMPIRVLKYATPLQTLKNTFPNTRLTSDLPLKNFGCTEFVHVPTHFLSKFDPRTKKCIFLGYAPNKKGYKSFNPITRKIHVSMDISFIEKIPFYNKTTLQGGALMKISFGNKNNQSLIFFFLK